MHRTWLVLCVVLAPACSRPSSPPQRDTLYQISTLNAVMLGVYDGEVTLGELRRHGDHGIGTLDGLDGELVLIDGTFFNVRSDGSVITPPEQATTPLATVTWFDVDKNLPLADIGSTAAMLQGIENALPNRNAFYLVRVDGTFSYVKTRSVPKQHKPYPSLAEAVRNQQTFEFREAEGTVVGIWCPAYAQGINLAGFHLHFITRDRTAGGHVFECHPRRATVSLDLCPDLFLRLPQNEAFNRAPIETVRPGDYQGVER